jgi:hypothetical protein
MRGDVTYFGAKKYTETGHFCKYLGRKRIAIIKSNTRHPE